MVPLKLIYAEYPRERISSGSGVPLKFFFAGYPRERISSGSGVPKMGFDRRASGQPSLRLCGVGFPTTPKRTRFSLHLN
jgi:hypothetical protein